MSEVRHPCPCCGYRTYAIAAAGTMQICPVCFWEDAPGEFPWNGSNAINLCLAQRNFAATGACEEEFIGTVRLPRAGESRDPDWISFETSRRRILELIEEAFRNVTYDGGVTLHQMQAMDRYESPEKIGAAALLDPEIRWQDISPEKIRKFGTSLTFYDAKAIRFHLGAFMRYSLECWAVSPWGDFSDTDFLICGLEEGPRSQGYHKDDFINLDSLQHQAIAAYLKFAAHDSFSGKNAQKALANGWQDWLPHFIPFPSLPS